MPCGYLAKRCFRKCAAVPSRDGAEVFRRFLPRYTRTAVAFVDDQRFAYTDWAGDRAELRVLRIAAR
jgi:hypothetical protein